MPQRIVNETVTSAVTSCVPGSTGVESSAFALAEASAKTGCWRGALLHHRRDRADAEPAGLGERERLVACVRDCLLQRVAVDRVAIRQARSVGPSTVFAPAPAAASISAPAPAIFAFADTVFCATYPVTLPCSSVCG